MTDRASIIEKAARAIARCEYGTDEEFENEWMGEGAWQDWCRREAAAALDAIAPPGEAWVAPWEATRVMKLVGGVRAEDGCDLGDLWQSMRDAYLLVPDKGKG